MINAHLEGILTPVITGATNARAEGFNTMIQKIKRGGAGSGTRNSSRKRPTSTCAGWISTRRRYGIDRYLHDSLKSQKANNPLGAIYVRLSPRAEWICNQELICVQ